MAWYKVTVFGTGRYVDLVEAKSKKEAQEKHEHDGGDYGLESTELMSVDGVEVEEATKAEIQDALQAVRVK